MMWQAVLNDQAIRSELGLKYISHMYDYCYYWYLWLEQMKGVYRVELEKVIGDEEWDWISLLKIKYYPHPDEPVFQGLAIAEQLCRVSDVFSVKPAEWLEGERCACHGSSHCDGTQFADLGDRTGVPSWEYNKDLPADFFFAGRAELYHKHSGSSRLLWQSQDRWQVTLSADYMWHDNEDVPLIVLRKGDVDRNFAGWQVTDTVGSILARAWGWYNKYGQISCWRGEEQGTVFVSDGTSLIPTVSADNKRRTECTDMTKGGIVA